MEYGKLISVTGLSGLFELLSPKTDGAIVKSLDDGVTKFVSSRIHQFSHLETIEVYTIRENVNLIEVFRAMESSAEALPDYKQPKAVRAYFEKVYPTMDFDRVYASDMKKMVRWYASLKEKNIALELSSEKTEVETN